MSNTETVQDFIAAWAGRDIHTICAYFAEDAFYHNIPMAPVEGRAAIREALAGFVGMAAEIEWVTHFIAETADGVVLTERTDRFRVGDNWLELPVMGTFELSGGKIRRWRDYFDLKMFETRMAQLTGA